MDPIGVEGFPEAADEYGAYVGTVGRMLREDAGADAIAEYLRQIRREHMGLADRYQQEELEKVVAV